MIGPPPTHGYVVAETFLGKPEVRAALREANPEVAGRLERLVGTSLKNLNLVGAHFTPGGDGTILDYEVTAATQEFYEDPVAALRNAGVIIPDAHSEDITVVVTVNDSGRPSESKTLEAHFNGFELYVEVLNPGYRAGRA